ncbi:MAG: histidine kinase [Bacteroidota bacterium]
MTTMEKKIFGFITVLFCCSFTYGQNSNGDSELLDSLRTNIKSENQIKRFNGYLELSRAYEEKNIDSSYFYAETAINYAVRLKRNDQIAQAYRHRGYLTLKKGDHGTSKKDIALAKTYFALDNDSLAIAMTNFELGELFYQGVQLNEALDKFLLAHDFFKTQAPSVKFFDTKSRIAKIYNDLEMYDKSREFETSALELSQVLNSPGAIMASKNRIALLLSKDNNFEEAANSFQEAIMMGMGKPDLKEELLIAFNGLAVVHYSTGKYELSLYCSNKSLEILDVNKYPNMAAHVYHTMGMSYLGLNQFSNSKKYLKKAYAKLTDSPSNVSARIDCNEGLYRLYEKMGNYKQALVHYKLFSSTRDSIYGKEINQKIIELESQRELAIKDREYERLMLYSENQKLKYRSKIKSTIIFCAIVLAITLLLFTKSHFKNRTLKTQKELLLAKNKLDSLRSQMNPHFIFNVINGVQNLILKSEKYEAYEHLNKFAESIRLMINNSVDAFIPIEEELKLVRNYVELEKVRFRDNFEFFISMPKGMLDSNLKIPSMIIQPIVENAIIHGLSNKKGQGVLKIDFHFKSENRSFLICEVEDNGIGRERAIEIKNRNKGEKNHLSIATTNTTQRIEILKQMGYNNASMEIEDLYGANKEPTGTRVLLTLPVTI